MRLAVYSIKIKNDIYGKLLLIAAVFCFIFFDLACDKKEDNSENTEMLHEIRSKMILLRYKPDQEIVALLSLKYHQNANIIENVVDQYLINSDFTYRVLKKAQELQPEELSPKQVWKVFESRKEVLGSKTDKEIELGVLEKSAYADLVAKISHQFSVDPSIVASILVDYKIMKSLKEAAEFKSGED